MDTVQLRIQATRRAKAEDPYRPFYHYVNPEYKLNDPNGLCFWQGCWHLFYQAVLPEETRWHWAHAVIPYGAADESPLPYGNLRSLHLEKGQ